MATICVEIIFYILILKGVTAEDLIDPCSDEVYKLLPRAAYRGGACVYDSNKETCDAAIISGWYRAIDQERNLKMQNQEADLFTCGTKFAIWMDGTHPRAEEGEVTRTLKQAATGRVKSVKVKNCNNTFFVYKLSPAGYCPEAYCFGSTNKDPCPPFDPCDIYEHQRVTYDPGLSRKCVSEENRKCENVYDKDWVVFKDGDGSFLNASDSPAGVGACGSRSPMWIKEMESIASDGIKTLKLCVESENNTCAREMTMRSKDCRWFTVYEVPDRDGCEQICLEDDNAECPGEASTVITVKPDYPSNLVTDYVRDNISPTTQSSPVTTMVDTSDHTTEVLREENTSAISKLSVKTMMEPSDDSTDIEGKTQYMWIIAVIIVVMTGVVTAAIVVLKYRSRTRFDDLKHGTDDNHIYAIVRR